MAGYGQYDIQPVDVFKPLMLGETMRQNRMTEELKTYQINKAKREDAAEQQVGPHLLGALEGNKASLAELARLDPKRFMAVMTFHRDAEDRGLNREYKQALIDQLRKRMAGGTGTGGILPPPAAMGGPVSASPVTAPLGGRPAAAPVAPTGGAPRPSPFGYSLPGQQSALPVADTTGADVPSPVPTETLPAAPAGAPALPPGRFQGIGGVPGLDPATPQPEGESGNEPPAAPVVPVQAPGAGPPTPGRAPVPGGPAWVRDALTQGYAPVRDAKNKALVEGDMMEMWTPDRKDRVFVPMKPPEKWAPDPNDPRILVNANGDRKAAPQIDKWTPDPNDPDYLINANGDKKLIRQKVQENWVLNEKLPNTLIETNSGRTKPIGSKPLTEQVRKDLSALGGTASEFDALASTFKNEPGEKGVRYGGYGREFIGDLANIYERNIGGDKTGEADWWSRYQTQKNIVRHGTFGAALTPTEQREFDKSDISPGMRPELIAKNLERQRQIALGAVSRLASSWLADGYGKEAIEAAIGIPLDQLPKPTLARPGSRLGTPAAPTDSRETKPPTASPANDLRKKYGLE